MNTATITQLNQLNQDFYHQTAESFSSTRHYPWQSWEKFLLSSGLSFQEQRAVADIGCGNGRFISWLNKQDLKFSYYGCDSNQVLRREAQQSFPDAQIEEMDVVERLVQKNFSLPGKFDLICLFGVFHHFPSFALRQEFFRKAAEAAQPGGELWLTTWSPRNTFLDRQRVCLEYGMDRQQLEAGDEFLGWKDSNAIRFVHCLQMGEMQALLAETPWVIKQQWQERERGERGNTCFLLECEIS